ncbi:MAG TPA: M48 family metallopeptidase, partial [Tepidisphaeraceae bacterium]
MKRHDFEAAVLRYQLEAKARPKWYRTKVSGMAMLGYIYLGGIIVALLITLVAIGAMGIKAPLLAIKLGIVPVILLFAVMRSLWVKLTPPEGEVITRRDAPELFKRLDDMATQLQCARVHRVLITDELNAALVQHPRLGILGFYRNYIICGLPLMMAMTRREFESVLAHELAHLSHGDGRFGAWIYRVNLTWQQLGERIARSGGGWLFSRFYDWWMPRFQAQSFVLRRQEEYLADEAAVKIAGVRPAGDALLLLHTASEEARMKFWDTIQKRSHTEPTPPSDIFTLYARSLRDRTDEVLLQRSIREALGQSTDLVDTHPALRERLVAMKYLHPQTPIDSVTVPTSPGRTAAEELLGAALTTLLAKYDQRWQKPIEEKWKSSYDSAQLDLRELAELEAKSDSLDVDQQLRLARLIEGYRDRAVAFNRVRDLAAAHPEHPGAAYVLGAMMLDERNIEGIPLIEQAMQTEAGFVRPGCDLLYAHYTRTGQSEAARSIAERAMQASEADDQAQQERLTWPPALHLKPHDLSDELIQPLLDWLRQDPQVKTAYLVRREVTLRPDVPAYMLAIVPKIGFLSFD